MNLPIARIVPTLFLSLLCYLIDAQNNVGIGTTNPTSPLDVQGDPASNTLNNLNSKVNYVGNIDVRAINGLSVTNPGYGIGGSFTGGYKGVDALCQGGSYSVTPLYGLYGNATGTAGIRAGMYGTASGAAANYGVWGFVNGGVNHYGVFGQNTNLAGYAGYFDGRGLFIRELRANDNLIVDDNLGIGTISPNTKLNIIGGADASLTTHGFIQLGATTSWNVLLDDNEILARNNGVGNDLFIQNDDGNVLLCASEQGGVGIGITAGTFLANGYIFSVDGKIIAEEMRIQNSDAWPDYVFEASYDLMSLDELQQSVALHKHLPNIPSAATVKTDGILVGDMQKKMMEKIEELTLYILELHEANKRMATELREVKSMIDDR